MPEPPDGRPFTFARGNLEKIAGLPRIAVGAARAHVTKRDPGQWAIGSNFGLADGAMAFYRAASAADPSLRLTWIAGDEKQARDAGRLGIEWVPRDSAAGFEATLTSGVVAVTHGFGDVNRYATSGATVVQLWHGSPLKKLHADSANAVQLGALGRVPGATAAMRAMYRRGTARISLLPVASERFVPSMCSAFNLTPAQVLATGEPRTDILFTGSVQQRREESRALLESRLGPLSDRRVVLYTPTWRDGEPDPSVPTTAQWRRIDEHCAATDSVLVIRPHPLGVGAYTYRSDYVRMLTSHEVAEVMPLLWGADTVITDYSSILFDFAVTGGPLVFLAPDLEHYAATRGLYEDYANITGGRWEQDWDGVLARLMRLHTDAGSLARSQAHSRRLAQTFHDHHDGRNAERVVARVLELTGQ